MKTKIKLFFFAIVITAFIPTLASAALKPFNPETDNCGLLGDHAILLVHTTWCEYCRKFEPTYEALANNKKYNKWTFYTFNATAKSAKCCKNKTALVVCGHTIGGYPTVFVNNQELKHANAESNGITGLQTYLDENK